MSSLKEAATYAAYTYSYFILTLTLFVKKKKKTKNDMRDRIEYEEMKMCRQHPIDIRKYGSAYILGLTAIS